MTLGVILVLLGVLLLLDSLGLIEGVGFAELWPILPIALGVMIILHRVRQARRRR